MKTITFDLAPQDNARLRELCGNSDENLHIVETHLAIEINHRGHTFKLIGPPEPISQAQEFINQLYRETASKPLKAQGIRLLLQQLTNEAKQSDPINEPLSDIEVVRLKSGTLKPRGSNQRRYIKRIAQHDINFAIGPAGTGKTYLAVACAIAALEQDKVRKIVLVRPAVEAGESLGFLPGDLAQKVDPYLRPMYDALYELMGVEVVNKLIEKQIIEIAPLAFMRGRTLNDAFIILDESQNTTKEQMKMFLTRIGFNSTAVITGDITQVDLPRGKTSGLRHIINVLVGVEGISFTFLDALDVIRHPLVQAVIQAYDEHERQSEDEC